MHAVTWYCTYLVLHYMAFNEATWLRDCVNHCKHEHDEKGEHEQYRSSAHHRLHIISVDVQDGSVEGLGHICAVGGAAALLGVCGESHLSTKEAHGQWVGCLI